MDLLRSTLPKHTDEKIGGAGVVLCGIGNIVHGRQQHSGRPKPWHGVSANPSFGIGTDRWYPKRSME